MPAETAGPTSLREVLERRLTDPRRRRGVRHALASLVSVLVTGVACGYPSFTAIAEAAAGWDQEVLAALGTSRNRVTGGRVPPSASTLGRLPALLDADELEAALTELLAGPALASPPPAVRPGSPDPAKAGGKPPRRRKPPAGELLREVSEAGLVRAAPAHPWLDPAVIGDSGHRPAVRAVGVDGKERRLAKAGGKKKVHLLAAITHHGGAVISQDRVAKAGKANEISHFRPLLEPLPLDGVVITSDAMQAQRGHARWLIAGKNAHYMFPILGNQPGTYQQLDTLAWGNAPVAAATIDVKRGRIETRTIQVLPAPPDLDFPGASQAVLIERYVTIRKNGQWVTRNCEAVLYLTSLEPGQASPAGLLAIIRGHWRIEHLHWLRDVIWEEDKSTIRTGNAPQVMSAITNLVITLFRIQGVTKIKAETRRNAQDPRRPLQLLVLRPG
ncbi:MAG: ISAs1 family transposase [Streptosporangiaceae bacterium]